MSDTVKAADLTDEQQEALKRLVLTLADSKRLMGIRYSDWLLGAPSIETGIAASSMCQDEWGHARLLYSMLKGFGIDPVPVEHDRPAEDHASIDPLDAQFSDWAAVVAGMVVVDQAITTVLESFADGRFDPAQTRVPKMLAEESFHSSLGRAWYLRLADSAPEARDLLVSATESMLPTCLAWVGTDDGPTQSLVDAGILGSAEDRLAAYREALSETLSAAGVDITAAAAATEWDERRGRGPGHPDEDAIARARGDLNRALFVE